MKTASKASTQSKVSTQGKSSTKRNSNVVKNNSKINAEANKENNKKIQTKSYLAEKKIENQEVSEKEKISKEDFFDKESKYDTISLKEIREALGNKVDAKQRKSVIKDVVISIGIGVLMILYLLLIIMGSKNIDAQLLEKDLKIMTLGILGLGIVILEISYKKDKSKIALYGVETLIFGAANLSLIYNVCTNLA